MLLYLIFNGGLESDGVRILFLRSDNPRSAVCRNRFDPGYSQIAEILSHGGGIFTEDIPAAVAA
jgi:hypothetical protein